MTIQDYENQNGFRQEFEHLREIGAKIVTLQEMIPARPHREPELVALRQIQGALMTLRSEISKTRDA